MHVPLKDPDFVPFVQHAKDAKPELLFVFVPAGKQATAIMKAYGDLGLAAAGIKVVGTQDLTPEEELGNMGDAPLGVITAGAYSQAATRPQNQAFVAAWKREYGAASNANFMAVGGWDGMAAIFAAIKAQGGKIDPDKTMKLLAGWKNPDSPRGPIEIDAETRDIVQNIYIRKVERRRRRPRQCRVRDNSAGQGSVEDPQPEVRGLFRCLPSPSPASRERVGVRASLRPRAPAPLTLPLPHAGEGSEAKPPRFHGRRSAPPSSASPSTALPMRWCFISSRSGSR